MSISLTINATYRITHAHDGAAIVRVLSVSDDGVMARVEMLDPLESVYQLPVGVTFKVVIARCTFETVSS